MKNNFLLLSILISIFSVKVSYAADVVYTSPEAPAYDEASIWGGGYIGAQVGYDWAKTKLSFNNQNASMNNNGFIGGIYAGYNWEFSNAYILGLEGDINYSDLSKNISVNNQSWGSRLEWEGAIRARIGFNYERVLPYLAAGISFAGVKDNYSNTTNNYADNNNTRTGYTLGAGIDYSLTNSFIIRAEYRYSDYGKKNIFSNNAESKISVNSVRLGLAYKF